MSKNQEISSSPVVLVTGGARRIGAEFCRGFAAAGWRVLIHCNNSVEAAGKLAMELGGREHSQVLVADLQDGNADGVVRDAVSVFGRLDAVVNNASTYQRRDLLKMTESELAEDFIVNFLSPFGIMRAFARLGKPGVILNILDGRISKQEPKCPGYLLAKKCLAEATQMCALAWGKLGIRVNGIAPGLVRPKDGVPLSAMDSLVAQLPLGVRTSEDELVKAAIYLAEAKNVTGEILYVDGGLHLANAELGEK